MKKILILLCLSNLFPAQNLLIKNVNLIPVNSGTVLTNMNVYITEGFIDKIVPATTKLAFKEYPTIEGKGKFLIPGMYDMHSHFPSAESKMSLDDYLKLQLAAGITSVRSMRGEESQLIVRDKIQKQEKRGPSMYVSYIFPESDSLLTKDKIFDIVFQAKIKKYDFIKYLGGINAKNMAHLSQACYEYKIPLAGHAFNKSLEESLANDFASIEHYQPVLAAYEKDSILFNKLIKEMKDKHVGLCPTLSFYKIYSFAYTLDDLLHRNGMQLANEELKTNWEKEYNDALNSAKEHFKDDFENKYVDAHKKKFSAFNSVLKKLANENMLLLLSPDECAFNIPGFSMAEEMKLYAEAGLSNFQILKCATINAATYLGKEKTEGTIENGKKANLVLLTANPLENIENIKKVEGTVLNGKYFSQLELLK